MTIVWIGYIRKKDLLMLFFIFAISGTILFAYPLFNEYHIKISCISCILGCSYVMDNWLSSKSKWSSIIIPSVFLAFMFALLSLYKNTRECYLIFKKAFKKESSIITIYNAMLSFSDETLDKIITVHDFCIQKEKEGYDVYILSYNASTYEIPYNINNHYLFDMLINGNFGYDGENKVIKAINNINKPLFLKLSHQGQYMESKIIDDYIKNNYNEIGKIEDFYIYSK